MKKAFFLLITGALIVFCSCKKETSNNDLISGIPEVITDTPETFAKFSLDTSDLCSAVTSHGVLHTRIPLTQADYLLIKVDVIEPGVFSYSTDTLNGFYFSAKGKFTHSGSQTIKLKGYGTPITPGNSRFSFTGTTIARVVPVVDADVEMEAVPEGGTYLKGKWGANDLFIEAEDPGGGGRPQLDTSGISTNIWPNYLVFPPAPGSAVILISKQYIHNLTTATGADFKAFFKPGAYPIVYRNCGPEYINGISLSLLDENKISWTTDDALDQQGSFCKIVGLEDGHHSNGLYYVKVKVRLSCMLANAFDLSETKKLEDAEAVLYFYKTPKL